jgi:hypothetical protein
MTRLLTTLAALAIVACDDEVLVRDPIIVPAPNWCEQAPVTTWANFGHGFLLENCQPCHATTSVDRHQAPAQVVFDTPEDVLLRKVGILRMATGAEPLMPPAGGVSEADRARLEAWLRCDFDPALR